MRLCYAMTINKSQGQTFERCGLMLDSAQCFAHGQLYVACSRVTTHDSLIVYTGYKKEGDEFVRKLAHNCVYKELFIDDWDNGKLKIPAVEKIDDQVQIGEEEPDQSITVIPQSAYNISEKEAVNMIMPFDSEKSDGEKYYEQEMEYATMPITLKEKLEEMGEQVEEVGERVEKINEKMEEQAEKINEKMEEQAEKMNEIMAEQTQKIINMLTKKRVQKEKETQKSLRKRRKI